MLIKEIIEATGGTLLSGHINDDIHGFTQDTRQIQQGDMYIPLIGEKNDGHQFIEQAFEKGASTVITSQVIDYPQKNVILVQDTLHALTDMATYLRMHRHVKVVGITGSVGKTSTKDMIYAVVSTQYHALKTLGNYNNHIGLPLTILRHHDEEVMVLEMGMNHLGEIRHLTKIAKPDVAVITNVGTAHIGELGSRENILKAKMEIVEGLSSQGVLIVNDDNDMLHGVVENGYHIIRIGKHEDCQLRAHHVQLLLEESYFDLDYQNQTYHVHVPVSGEHFVTNALLAIAVGLSLKIDIEKCIAGIEQFELTQKRMDVIELAHHIKVIDGTYNANLDSMKSSLDVLAQYPQRKIAILADMLELGEYAQAFHEEVGEYVAKKHINQLWCVGQASQWMATKAKENGIETYHFENNQQLIDALKNHLKDDDVILLKGSNGMHLQEIVEYLKETYKK